MARPADLAEDLKPALNKVEQSFQRIVTPFEEFIHEETTSGLLLMACTLAALVLANSQWAHAYHEVLHTHLVIGLGPWTLDHTVHHWINDGLMSLFFFVVGLEIKRELLVGELSDPRQAVLPVVAALGGMLVPAGLYALLNAGGAGEAGWGIPMATDIAFAVGILSLLGKRVPPALLTFLVALAIVDDLGAVAVIALFYTDQLVLEALFMAAGLFMLLLGFNVLGIRRPLPYFVVGGFIWLAMLESGVHATIAGILVAWTIPARSRFSPEHFSHLVRRLMTRYDEQRARSRDGKCTLIEDEAQRRAMVQTLENGVHMMETPLQRLEHGFHMPVAYIVIPLFALANAGIPIHVSELPTAVTHPITLGVMIGLVLGKLVGIAGVSILAVRLGIGRLPAGASVQHIIGVGLLGGVGFTMSIFIAELGFRGEEQTLVMAKTGILLASLLAGVAGYLWLRRLSPPSA
jgi:NhaA family Na+:H+ antiporter